jgi:hypothetical protein
VFKATGPEQNPWRQESRNTPRGAWTACSSPLQPLSGIILGAHVLRALIRTDDRSGKGWLEPNASQSILRIQMLTTEIAR